MTDFADDAQLIEEAERDRALVAIRRQTAAPAEIRERCVACDDPIDPARLEANPRACRCLSCQEAFELRQRLSRKG